MQWIIFGILAAVVISGVRRMARDVSTAPGEPPRSPFATSPPQQQPNKQVDVQDTVQCSVCHAYMVKNAASCGREGCPFGK